MEDAGEEAAPGGAERFGPQDGTQEAVGQGKPESLKERGSMQNTRDSGQNFGKYLYFGRGRGGRTCLKKCS